MNPGEPKLGRRWGKCPKLVNSSCCIAGCLAFKMGVCDEDDDKYGVLEKYY